MAYGRGPSHKTPSTRNPALRPQGVRGSLVRERHACHGKTIEAQGIQGTLETSRVFLGMGLHCDLPS
eukprot:2109688-Pyramimonas_sp.AAC.1